MDKLALLPSPATTLTIDTCSPAKLILSGEHAVIYGSTAISLPIPMHSHCHLEITPSNQFQLRLTLNDFGQERTFSKDEIRERFAKIRHDYHAFCHGQKPHSAVLNSHFDLILVCWVLFNQHHSLPKGNWQLTLNSEIPMNRGLGSSASVIISVLKALALTQNHPLSESLLLSLSKQIESYQHGNSSGLDPTTISLNQAIAFTNGQFSPLTLGKLPGPLNAWLIDTGASQSATGETVNFVKQHFAKHADLWQNFRQTTQQLQAAWQTQNAQKLLNSIHKNQQLLTSIGVVPERVQNHLANLTNTLGGAAKVCGAGSISGDRAGVVLYLGEKSPEDFCKRFDYTVYPLELV